MVNWESVIDSLVRGLPAIATVVGSVLGYLQYTKNKQTDLQVDKMRAEMETKKKQDNYNVSVIYGELWQLLHTLGADRVYIIQPHPLIKSLYLSISLEVRRTGVSGLRDAVDNLPMSDVAVFASELAQRDFLLYRDIEHNVKDKKAKAILSSNGASSIIMKRMSDDDYDWVGTLCCEYMRECKLEPAFAKSALQDASSKIQYILPEYK